MRVLERQLKSSNPALRRKALYSLDPNSFDLFKEVLLKDPSPVIRHEAAFLLGKSKNNKAVAILIRAIETDESDLVRHEAIEALGDLKVHARKVIDLLRFLQNDKNLFIRDTAEVALLTLETHSKTSI